MKHGYIDIHTHRPADGRTTIRTAGIHPWDAATVDPAEAVRRIDRAAANIDAVGEIGLDFAAAADRGAQEELFRAQLGAAVRLGLPVVLHCVRAFEETMRALRGGEPRAVIFHGFIGSAVQAQRATARGYMLSFGERSLRSPRTLEALRQTPDERLFLETDDSETPIGEIYARAAAVRACTVGELAAITETNYERIFKHG